MIGMAANAPSLMCRLRRLEFRATPSCQPRDRDPQCWRREQPEGGVTAASRPVGPETLDGTLVT